MAKRTVWPFVYVAALGLLVFVLGALLLLVAAPLFLPDTGGIVIFVSKRAFSISLIVLLTVVAAVLFFFARTGRRRRLK